MSSVTCEDSDQLSELEAIQKELEEVLAKKEMFEKRGKNANFTGNEGMFPLEEREVKMITFFDQCTAEVLNNAC